jgi:hypothetical protein
MIARRSDDAAGARCPLRLAIDTTDAVVGEPQPLTSELVTVGPRSLIALGYDPRQAQGEL